ncbi:8-oxoguanine glycosylase OGG1 [Aspergillus mulundensis]|uniref:DNA-(apurinic or apyrimidinic site) lyase n=1 Tax=Aspergillus mulundensis TaxID=1810919 RepID=A0A3D8SBN2_9EURO|nr:Mitochondrial glycosylase [Aspergillus mulundensis]RDW83757.1 Mitochondrial glycosylase [Aspergillus mulundensis]
MTVGTFSEWRKLSISLSELCINTTLRCGQSFRWHKVPDNDEWRCVLYGRLVCLKQDPTHLHYRTYVNPKISSSTNDGEPEDTTLDIIKHYFNLNSNLTTLYAQWSSSDPNFRKKASQFTGIRILRQDAWEALISFICSSNNNITRIGQMVEKLCLNYGAHVADVDGRAYHDFPSPGRLAEDGGVEARLRSLGFGYRAKYIYQTAVIVAKQKESGWLNSLRNPEAPAFGVEAVVGQEEEMPPEGRSGYREAHEKLLELQGVGPKVADCVSLMGLGWGESVPVDTHVWQIAHRDYKFGKGSHKSLTKATYDAVGNHFRKLWGKEAGWAHSVLFTADLKTFSDRLVATTKQEKVEVKVKEEETDRTEILATTTETNVSLKRAVDEDKIKLEPDDKKVKLETNSVPGTRRSSRRLRR